MVEPSARRIALLCAQVPGEIVEACGLEPWAISGREETAADAALPQNLCSLVRRAAALLRPAATPGLAAVVLSDSCHPLLRLHDHLQAGGGAVPVLLLRVPRRSDAPAVAFFREELERLARSLESLGGRYPDDQTLAAAVAAGAHRRQARSAFLAATLANDGPELTAELLRGLEAHAPLPEALLAAAPLVGGPARPRLLLAGSCFVSGELIRVLGELGAAVVAVDACGYARHGDAAAEPPAGADPWSALAEGWLARPPCPRSEDAGSRATAAAALAAAGAIDAVLYLRTACCTPQGYDLARWRRRLQTAGVPFCAVEADSPAWSQPRLLTRLEAFVESLARRPGARCAAG